MDAARVNIWAPLVVSYGHHWGWYIYAAKKNRCTPLGVTDGRRWLWHTDATSGDTWTRLVVTYGHHCITSIRWNISECNWIQLSLCSEIIVNKIIYAQIWIWYTIWPWHMAFPKALAQIEQRAKGKWAKDSMPELISTASSKGPRGPRLQILYLCTYLYIYIERDK